MSDPLTGWGAGKQLHSQLRHNHAGDGDMSTSGEDGRPLRIALLGTRGVPARYGGFETCVDEVGRRLAARGHEVVVYCRTTKVPTPPSGSMRECSSYICRRCAAGVWRR